MAIENALLLKANICCHRYMWRIIRNPYGTEDVWCVCVVCSAPGLHGRVYSAPSYSVAGGLPRRGPFMAAAMGSSMTLGGPHWVGHCHGIHTHW